MNNNDGLKVTYVGKIEEKEIIQEDFSKIKKIFRKQNKIAYSNPYNEILALSLKKTNWHITFQEDIPKEPLKYPTDIFILVPENLYELKRYISYFVDRKLFRPWMYGVLIYDFYSKQKDIEKITTPVGCKVFNRRNLQGLPEYIAFVEEQLAKL